MIRLNAIPKEPYWLDLPFKVRVKVVPPTTALCGQARAVSARMVAELLEDIRQRKEVGADVAGLPDLEDDAVRAGVAHHFTAVAYARAAIREWEGVYPASGNELAPVNAQTVTDLMRIDDMAAAFMARYLASIDALVTEGNVSGPAPNGTGGAGQVIAPDAGTSAQPAPTGAPEKTEPTAPTSNTLQ